MGRGNVLGRAEKVNRQLETVSRAYPPNHATTTKNTKWHERILFRELSWFGFGFARTRGGR